MWKNMVENAYEHISLHACIVNHIENTDHSLSLTLNNGFWILADAKYHSCGETVRTDQSRINCIHFDEEMSVFCLFKRHYLLGKYICTTMKSMDFEKLFKKINSNEWEMEFSDQYNAYHRNLFCGSINTKKKLVHLIFN